MLIKFGDFRSNEFSAHGLRSVALLLQFTQQTRQLGAQVRFERTQVLPIYSGRTLVAPNVPERFIKYSPVQRASVQTVVILMSTALCCGRLWAERNVPAGRFPTVAPRVSSRQWTVWPCGYSLMQTAQCRACSQASLLSRPGLVRPLGHLRFDHASVSPRLWVASAHRSTPSCYHVGVTPARPRLRSFRFCPPDGYPRSQAGTSSLLRRRLSPRPHQHPGSHLVCSCPPRRRMQGQASPVTAPAPGL